MGYREWTKDEIAKLIEGTEMFRRRRGIDWKAVSRYVGTRTERQCQDRFFTRTKNGIVTKSCNQYVVWTPEEERLLTQLVSMHGHKWTMFVDYFPGRDPNKIKSKYYNMVRSSGQQIEGGSSYDSSYVEQQRLCLSYQDNVSRMYPNEDCNTDDVVYEAWQDNNEDE